MEKLSQLLRVLDNLVWGPWMLCLFLGTGAYLMIRMRFLPIRNLGFALKCIFGERKSGSEEGISPFSALMTELAATIGTGNIVGVATAMVLGGPGALVWMVISSLVGLSTKFAESMLAVKYRVKNSLGEYCGGPMYTLERGFPFAKAGKKLAVLYASAAVFASFGMGNMTQSNAIAEALDTTFGISAAKSGLMLTFFTVFAVLGGIRSIAAVTQVLVPAMAVLYLLGSFCVIGTHWENIGNSMVMILQMAFTKEALAGGVGGHLVATMQQAMRWGVARGVFSNEAGLGAGGISAAAAQTEDPVHQGYVSMTGVFLDTVVICSVTGLTLAASGVLGMTDREGELLTGTDLTIAAFSTTFGEWGAILVTVGIVLFAFATIIGWAYQGEKAYEYLVKDPAKCMYYRFGYGLITFAGAVCSLEMVWNFADICNAVMALPNLLCVLVMAREPVRAIRNDRS